MTEHYPHLKLLSQAKYFAEMRKEEFDFFKSGFEGLAKALGGR